MSNTSSHFGRWIAAGLAALLLLAVFGAFLMDVMPKGEARKVEGYKPWPAETIRVMEALPVQDGGRIKPLSAFAGFKMYGLHGQRSMAIEGEPQKFSPFARFIRKLRGKNDRSVTLKPTAWMMDALFRPAMSIEQPTFRIDNSAVLEAIGVKPRGKRDRYSYAEIEPGRAKLGELAASYQSIDDKKRDPVQNQTIELAANLQTYESLIGYFSFSRTGVVLRGSTEDSGTDKRADVSALMATAPIMREQIEKARADGKGMEPHIRDLLEQVFDAANFAKFSLFIIPPPDKEAKHWLSAGNAIMDTMSGASKNSESLIADIKALETLGRTAPEDEAKFRENLTTARDRFVNRAKERGQYERIELEATYYRKDLFLYAMIWFLTGLVASLGMWATGNTLAGRIFAWTTAGCSLLGLGYCLVAIAMRCIIMQRPPVGNLYDTIIFIAATMVAFALLIEFLVRRRFALGIAPIAGTLLIILSRRFEMGDAKDHMDPLVAVLDSNFWLTIHVITITLGYAAGLLSAKLSVAYILMRGFGLDGGNQSYRRSMTRAVYGMLCFTLFLSLVGTVLGGIWANYSWGRFWGWDPKENGALLIVLWTLAILHARLGGYLREWGLHLASIFTAIVVTFSWWHVNFLGVGLHNYGFTAGKSTIWMVYAVLTGIIVFGVITMIVEKVSKVNPSSPAPQPDPSTAPVLGK
jgi:ABC-type transport system involved in cytochrome c biogenesis permease subunit